MRLQRLHHLLGQHRHPVLAALAVAHRNLPVGEVHVLHPQRQALDLPQPRAIQQARHQPFHALQLLEEPARLGLRQHHRGAHRPLGPHHAGEPGEILSEDLLVQKQQRRQRLILRGGRDIALRREPAQERLHLARAELGGMPRPVVEDEPADPEPIGLLGPPAVAALANLAAEAVAQPGLSYRAGRYLR